jgi:hypothetical protein
MQGGECGIGLEGVRGQAGLGLDRGVRVERLPKNATWAAREQANPAGLGSCSAGERGGRVCMQACVVAAWGAASARMRAHAAEQGRGSARKTCMRDVQQASALGRPARRWRLRCALGLRGRG